MGTSEQIQLLHEIAGGKLTEEEAALLFKGTDYDLQKAVDSLLVTRSQEYYITK